MAAKAAMGRQERGALVNRTLTTVYQASAVALAERYEAIMGDLAYPEVVT